MRIIRLAAFSLMLLLVASGSALGHHKASKEFKKGQVFCPSQVLVVGNVIVRSGRCYVLAVLRDGRGTFLAFVHPSAKIPAKVVSLDSSHGRKIRGKIIHLVPIQTTGLAFIALPLNTIQLVQIQERRGHDDDDDDDDDDDRKGKNKGKDEVVLVITGMPIPNLSVTFVIRF